MEELYYHYLQLAGQNPQAAATLVLADILLQLLDQIELSDQPGPPAHVEVRATVQGEPVEVEVDNTAVVLARLKKV